MTNRWRITAGAVALAALLCPVGRAHAFCTTSLADTTSTECKAAAACQKQISASAAAYVNAVQKNVAAFINKSQVGGFKAAPVYKCVGGPNTGKACLDHNGICKTGKPNALGPCSLDADCGGSAGSCDKTKGCNPSSPDNTFECQVNQTKDTEGKIQAAQTKLRADIRKKCVTIPVPGAILGINNIPNCPGVGTAVSEDDLYDAMIDCIKNSVGGDLDTGNTVDTSLQPFQLSTGTGALRPNNKVGTPPRMLLQLTGSQSLQIGNGSGDATSNGLTGGGSVTPLSLAHCMGGNGNTTCIKDIDCGLDGSSVAGTCVTNTDNGSEKQVTGARVFDPLDPTSDGPTLTESASCAGGVATCLVTHTKNSGNGTTTTGQIDLLTGHYTAASPILTDVYVVNTGVDCLTFKPCPVCNHSSGATGTCSNNFTNLCTASDQAVTVECPPSGSTNIHIPNPFVLSTDPKTLTPASGNKFCGFCDTGAASGCQHSGAVGDSVCAHGCQVLADCAGTGATVCDFGSSVDGFHGDTSVTSVKAPGANSQYEPLVSGIFCTGRTGNTLVDPAAGLPGPVRVIIPYTFGYVMAP